LDQVKVLEVCRRITQGRFSNAIDSDNTVISRGTLIRITNRDHPMKGQLGEIRAVQRDTLFIWIKSSLLMKSNGVYCVKVKDVKNAGAKHLREANEAAGLDDDENQAVPDRQKRDS